MTHIDTDQHSEIELTPGALDQVLAYSTADGLSPDARVALQHLVSLRQTVSANETTGNRLAISIKSVTDDEARIRLNLQTVNSSDSLRSRLVKQLEADEDKLADLLRQKDDATAATDKARAALSDAVAELSF